MYIPSDQIVGMYLISMLSNNKDEEAEGGNWNFFKKLELWKISESVYNI